MTRQTLNPNAPRATAAWALSLTLVLVTSATLAAPTRASAQRLTWPELSSLGLTTIYVFDERGGEVAGVVRSVTTDSLVIMMPGGEARAFQTSQVRRIERRGDSLKNGFLIGAGVGLLSGLTLIGSCSDPVMVIEECAATVASIAAVGTVMYGLLGAGIDAMIVGRTTVYRGPAPPTRTSLSPIIKPSGDGTRLGLRVRFR